MNWFEAFLDDMWASFTPVNTDGGLNDDFPDGE